MTRLISWECQGSTLCLLCAPQEWILGQGEHRGNGNLCPEGAYNLVRETMIPTRTANGTASLQWRSESTSIPLHPFLINSGHPIHKWSHFYFQNVSGSVPPLHSSQLPGHFPHHAFSSLQTPDSPSWSLDLLLQPLFKNLQSSQGLPRQIAISPVPAQDLHVVSTHLLLNKWMDRWNSLAGHLKPPTI